MSGDGITDISKDLKSYEKEVRSDPERPGTKASGGCGGAMSSAASSTSRLVGLIVCLAIPLVLLLGLLYVVLVAPQFYDPDCPRRLPDSLNYAREGHVIPVTGLVSAAPENSGPGLAAAADAGWPWVEIDVLMSEDGVPWALSGSSSARISGEDIGSLPTLTDAQLGELAYSPAIVSEYSGAVHSYDYSNSSAPRLLPLVDLLADGACQTSHVMLRVVLDKTPSAFVAYPEGLALLDALTEAGCWVAGSSKTEAASLAEGLMIVVNDPWLGRDLRLRMGEKVTASSGPLAPIPLGVHYSPDLNNPSFYLSNLFFQSHAAADTVLLEPSLLDDYGPTLLEKGYCVGTYIYGTPMLPFLNVTALSEEHDSLTFVLTEA